MGTSSLWVGAIMKLCLQLRMLFVQSQRGLIQQAPRDYVNISKAFCGCIRLFGWAVQA